MDYQGNSKKSREPKDIPSKNVEKVIKGEVIVQKKTLGRKFKDIFVEADIKSVVRYVTYEVLIPAAKNMFVDGVESGVRRMTYGESASRRRGIYGTGARYQYNNPINRSSRETIMRAAPIPAVGPRSARYTRDDFILTDRGEAEQVLERMSDILDNYQVVSVADLNELVGISTSHMDNKWGWFDLTGVQIRQIREGYLLDLPPAEHIP